MRGQLESLIIAFSMYSRIPVPGIEWNEKNMRWCMCYFPLIGLVIGLLCAGWDALCAWLQAGSLFRAAVLTIIPVIVTGGIHLDGMLDTFDALASGKSREEQLAIMHDSHSGAFAVIACACYFLLMAGIFSETDSAQLRLIGIGFAVSRAYSALALVLFEKAGSSKLLRLFADRSGRRTVAAVMILYITAADIALVCLNIRRGAVMALLALLTFIWYHSFSRRRYGGITGDLAGFFLQICELVMFLGVILL